MNSRLNLIKPETIWVLPTNQIVMVVSYDLIVGFVRVIDEKTNNYQSIYEEIFYTSIKIG